MRVQQLSDIRTTTPGMRLILLIASGLVFIVGIQLFVLTHYTDRFFAWTIDSALTAAFLGGSYWASFALEFFAARQRTWANARIAVPAVLIFTTLTLIITLVHRDRFHFDHPVFMTRFAAWAWLIVYAIVPPAMALLLFRQLRQPGSDPSRAARLPDWGRAVLLLHTLVLAPLGIILLLTPDLIAPAWPWALTPLTGRAVGAWLLSLGIAALHAQWENDWRRVRIAAGSYAIFAVLQLLALARYPNEMQWGQPAAWVYLLFILLALTIGLYGWRRAGRFILVESPVGG